jgi:hypothetical protein
MIHGTIIKNGTIKLVLTGTDEIDMAVLKQLDGATVSTITDNLRIGDKHISGGLILETIHNKRADAERTTDMVHSTTERDKEEVL